MRRFLQMARLRVEFAHIQHGWVQTRFWVDETEHEMWFSCAVCGDAFARLCEALLWLLDDKADPTVTWMDEPQTYDMCFCRCDDRVQLEVRQFETWQRNLNSKSALEFEISGNYTEICVPLWRALKELRGIYPRDEEFEARWHHPFPNREFAALTDALRARRLT